VIVGFLMATVGSIILVVVGTLAYDTALPASVGGTVAAFVVGPKWRDVERALRDQGWRLEETESGVMCYPPDKRLPAVSVHRDPTPPGIRKALSRMKQYGLVWPWPPRKGEKR